MVPDGYLSDDERIEENEDDDDDTNLENKNNKNKNKNNSKNSSYKNKNKLLNLQIIGPISIDENGGNNLLIFN